MKPKTKTKKPTRKQKTEQMIARCRAAEVVLLNKPDPFLLSEFFRNYVKSLTPENFDPALMP